MSFAPPYLGHSECAFYGSRGKNKPTAAPPGAEDTDKSHAPNLPFVITIGSRFLDFVSESTRLLNTHRVKILTHDY